MTGITGGMAPNEGWLGLSIKSVEGLKVISLGVAFRSVDPAEAGGSIEGFETQDGRGNMTMWPIERRL